VSWWSLFAALVVASGGFGVAHAQVATADLEASAARATTEATFTAGLAALDAGDLETAESLFRDALEADNQDRYRYNLALALMRAGKYVQTVAVLRPLVSNAAGDPLFGEAASELERNAREQIGTLVVEGRREEVVAVRVGDLQRTLAEGRLGLAVDPGLVEFAALDADDDEILSTVVEVAPGAVATVSIAEARESPVDPLAIPLGTSDDDDDESVLETWWFWTAVGGVVVVSALVTWIALSAGGGSASPSPGNVPPVFVGGMP
jgi:hypothetical protein